MMGTLNDLLAGIVADPLEETRWLVLADWLEEYDDIRRAELLRLHRQLLATCCEPDAHLERGAWQDRVVELIASGVRPCVPQKTVQFPSGVPMTFSFIPPGSFLMGGSVDDWEPPIHKVTLTNGFYLGIYPVTQSQWEAVMGYNPSHFKGSNRPVERVSWVDCPEFCQSLTTELQGHVPVRLPTEAEWEYACRSGTTSEYHFGEAINSDLLCHDGRDRYLQTGKSRRKTTIVGSFPANPWGLYDMHGNVWEWCEDWYGAYPGGEETGPRGQSSINGCILRGGCWNSGRHECRAASRKSYPPMRLGDNCGIRLLLPVEQ